MNIATALMMDSQSKDVKSFLDEHGDRLNRIFQAAYGNPFVEPAKSILNASEQALNERTISLDSVLSEAVDTLLDLMSARDWEFPEQFDAREVDACIRWYAARLIELQRS